MGTTLNLFRFMLRSNLTNQEWWRNRVQEVLQLARAEYRAEKIAAAGADPNHAVFCRSCEELEGVNLALCHVQRKDIQPRFQGNIILGHFGIQTLSLTDL